MIDEAQLEHLPWRLTPAAAHALGFTHEGTQFGIPVYAEFDENNPEVMGYVVTKYRAMELLMDVMLGMFQLLNSFRAEEDQIGFPFLIRPIELATPL